MVDDQRRKAVGKRIARARRAAGHRSQASFADALPYSESAVALAESGSPRVGPAVFEAIEDALGLPANIIADYLAAGDNKLLDQIRYTPPGERSSRTPAAVKPTRDGEGWTDEDQLLISQLRLLAETRGIDKVTSALIEAVREIRRQSENQEPDTDSDASQQSG